MLVEFSLSSWFRRDNIACTSYLYRRTNTTLIKGKYLRTIYFTCSEQLGKQEHCIPKFVSFNTSMLGGGWRLEKISVKQQRRDVPTMCFMSTSLNGILTAIISQAFYVMQRTLAISFCIDPYIWKNNTKHIVCWASGWDSGWNWDDAIKTLIKYVFVSRLHH